MATCIWAPSFRQPPFGRLVAALTVSTTRFKEPANIFDGVSFHLLPCPSQLAPRTTVKYKFIKTTFIQKKFSSKSTFIKNHFHQNATFTKNHFHQKPLSSKTIFIKNQFHQKPISSETTFIKNQFHQKPISSETNFIRALPVRGTHHPSKNNIVRVCVKASRAQTRLVPTFGVSAGLFVEHCRPKAGNVQQKGPLRVQRWVFRV